ncbi:MAG: hypothetical protein JST26_04480 [Bacteroidetes bacterium]|nr:hypothetical protein [Bacteroidota bacterium]
MRIILILIATSLCFSFGKSFFLVETFYVKLNRQNIGHWNVNKKIPEKITVSFKQQTDTLCFVGVSDCGALDGTIIKIKDKNELILKLTRISDSGILRNDTIMINPQPERPQTFALDHVVAFYSTPATFKNLKRGKIYSVYYERIIDKDSKEVHIFDLQLK